MDKMLAAIWYGPGRENLRLEEIERPHAGPGEVVLKVKACFWGAMYNRAVLKGHPRLTPPTIFGRMVGGDVVEIGEGVSNVRLGMRATFNPEAPCGRCYYCLRDQPVHCLNVTELARGGMAEYILLSKELVPGICEIPSHVPYEQGAYCETLACVLNGVIKANVVPGDVVVILGCGGIGTMFTQLLRNRGAGKIIVTDIADERLSAVAGLSRVRTVNVTKEDLLQVVKEATEGHGADAVVEAVGSAKTYQEAIGLVRDGGTVVGFGGCPPNSSFPFDPNALHYRSLNLVGSYHYPPGLYKRAMTMIADGLVDLKPIITHHLPLKRIAEAVDLYQQPDCKNIIIEP